MQGFVVAQFADHFKEASEQLAQWVSEGKIKFEVTIDEGFDNLPSAFRKLFTGENFGKQVVKSLKNRKKAMKNIIVRFIFSLLFYKSGVAHFKNKDMF